MIRKLLARCFASCYRYFSPIFFYFHSFVQRRNDKVVKAAVRSTAIVSSMFPSNVRDRLYKDIEENEKNQQQHGILKTFLRDSNTTKLAHTDSKTSPLADLFAETTVLVRLFDAFSISF
jgi:hypothetical protein